MPVIHIPSVIDESASVEAQTAAQARTKLGEGTMSVQNANAVAITGGNVDGTPVGATTRSTVQATTVDAKVSDAGTTSEPVALSIEHESSGTPSTNFGVGYIMRGKSDTVSSRDMARIGVTWDQATDASRRARLKFYTYSGAAGALEGLAISGGAAASIGFLGATPIVKYGATSDLRQLLIDFGLLTTGGASPLDLNGGTLAAGSLTLTTALAIAQGGTGSTTASAARTALGLAINTDVQAWSAKLDTLAALSSITNLSALAGLNGTGGALFPYFTGSGTMGTIAFTPTAPGAWTPTIVGVTTPGTHTYSTQYGYYWVWDQLVFAGGRVQISTKNSSGAAMAGVVRIGGLPFTVKNTTSQYGPMHMQAVDKLAFTGYLGGYCVLNTTQIGLAKNVSGTAQDEVDLQAADVGTTPSIIFGGFFQKA